jgi:hypothetical protein
LDTRKPDDISVMQFLDTTSKVQWRPRPPLVCPTVSKEVQYEGRANKYLFHVTENRDGKGLPDYNDAIKELGRAYSECFGLMAGYEKEAFRSGLDDEWEVASAIGL